MWRRIVATLCVVAAGAATSAQSPPLLTLEQAVKEALVKNDRLLNQHDSTAQATLAVRLARNAFQPKVVPNVIGSFGQSDINNQTYRVDVSQRFTTGTELRVGTGTSTAQIPALPGVSARDIHYYNADTTLMLSQPLLKGFGSNVARRPLSSAELRRDEANRQQTLAEYQVAVDVASAYYRVVAQHTFVEVARNTVERSRRLRDASEAKLGAGLVSQLDVLRAQQLVAQAEIQLFDAQAAGEDARDLLLFLIGHDAGELVAVEMDIPRTTDAMAVGEAMTIALERRLDLRSAVENGVDADRHIAYTRNSLLPQIDANLALTRRETAPGFSQSFGMDGYRFLTFLTIAMPIDRTPQIIDHQNALIERDRRQREVATLQRRISDDVRRTIRERDRLVRSLVAAETSVEIGRKEVEVAQLRYERGLSNNLDVVTAEGNLLAAEARRIAALADAAVARLSLRATLGMLDPQQDFRNTASAPDRVVTLNSTRP